MPSGSSAVLAGLTVTGGRATTGAGVFVAANAQLSLYDTIFEENVAAQRGGGIHNAGGSLILFYSTVAKNRVTGGSGGGLAGDANSNSGVFYATVSGNTALSGGGGIVTGGTLQLQNATIAANTAAAGGGLFQESVEAANTAMWGTILAGNSGGACGGSIAGVSRSIWSQNLADDTNCLFRDGGAGNRARRPATRLAAQQRRPHRHARHRGRQPRDRQRRSELLRAGQHHRPAARDGRGALRHRRL